MFDARGVEAGWVGSKGCRGDGVQELHLALERQSSFQAFGRPLNRVRISPPPPFPLAPCFAILRGLPISSLERC